MGWEIINSERLTHTLLASLFEDEIAAIRIPNFMPVDVCLLAVRGIFAHGIDYYTDTPIKVGRVGITQHEHKYSHSQKLEYFSKVKEANVKRQQILKDSGDILLTVIDYLREAWGKNVDIAFEADLGEYYYAGVVRVMKKSFLHADWAPASASSWAIGKISAQLTWNIFLQLGSEGGTTKVYRRFCQDDDDEDAPDFLKGYDSVEIIPNQGDFILFNPHNYHEVESTEGEIERITMSSFIGLLEPAHNLILWS